MNVQELALAHVEGIAAKVMNPEQSMASEW